MQAQVVGKNDNTINVKPQGTRVGGYCSRVGNLTWQQCLGE